MAFREYEDLSELRKTQEILTRMLGEFDRVCRLLNLDYVVWGGTAIGAVRHNGFIPWDDDIDVAMPRKDYERFIKEAPAHLSEGYGVANNRNEPNFPGLVTYLTLEGTRFIPDYFASCEYEKPFSLDIIPLDLVPDDDKKYKRKNRKTWIWGRLKYVRSAPKPYLPFDGWRKNIIYALTISANGLMRVFRISPSAIEEKWEKAAQLYNDENSEWIAEFNDKNPKQFSAKKSELFPAIDHPFENLIVSIPKDYDTILTRNYGDYMSLPPEEERKNHYPSVLDFGPYA